MARPAPGTIQFSEHPAGIRHSQDTVKKMARLAREDAYTYKMREFLALILRDVPSKQPRQELETAYKWVRDHVRYRNDPEGMEWVQRPLATLRLLVGDCDDIAALLKSIAIHLGRGTRLETRGPTEWKPKHVLVLAQLPSGEWITLDPVLEPPASSTAPRADPGKFAAHAPGSVLRFNERTNRLEALGSDVTVSDEKLWQPVPYYPTGDLGGDTTPRFRRLWQTVPFFPQIPPTSGYANPADAGRTPAPHTNYRSAVVPGPTIELPTRSGVMGQMPGVPGAPEMPAELEDAYNKSNKVAKDLDDGNISADTAVGIGLTVLALIPGGAPFAAVAGAVYAVSKGFAKMFGGETTTSKRRKIRKKLAAKWGAPEAITSVAKIRAVVSAIRRIEQGNAGKPQYVGLSRPWAMRMVNLEAAAPQAAPEPPPPETPPVRATKSSVFRAPAGIALRSTQLPGIGEGKKKKGKKRKKRKSKRRARARGEGRRGGRKRKKSMREIADQAAELAKLDPAVAELVEAGVGLKKAKRIIRRHAARVRRDVAPAQPRRPPPASKQPDRRLSGKYPPNARQLWDPAIKAFRIFIPSAGNLGGLVPSFTFQMSGAPVLGQVPPGADVASLPPGEFEKRAANLATLALNAVDIYIQNSATKTPPGRALPAVADFQEWDAANTSGGRRSLDVDGLYGPNVQHAAAYYLQLPKAGLPPFKPVFRNVPITWQPPLRAVAPEPKREPTTTTTTTQLQQRTTPSGLTIRKTSFTPAGGDTMPTPTRRKGASNKFLRKAARLARRAIRAYKRSSNPKAKIAAVGKFQAHDAKRARVGSLKVDQYYGPNTRAAAAYYLCKSPAKLPKPAYTTALSWEAPPGKKPSKKTCRKRKRKKKKAPIPGAPTTAAKKKKKKRLPVTKKVPPITDADAGTSPGGAPAPAGGCAAGAVYRDTSGATRVTGYQEVGQEGGNPGLAPVGFGVPKGCPAPAGEEQQPAAEKKKKGNDRMLWLLLAAALGAEVA